MHIKSSSLRFVSRFQSSNPSSTILPIRTSIFDLCFCEFLVHHRSKWKHRKLEISQLPLEPIERLQAIYKKTQREDRKARLKEILSLPLAQMVQYTKEGRKREVVCTLCTVSLTKDKWADAHFRIQHWEQYCAIRESLVSEEDYDLPSGASKLPRKPSQVVTAKVYRVVEDLAPKLDNSRRYDVG